MTIFYYNSDRTKKGIAEICRLNGVAPPTFRRLEATPINLFGGGPPIFQESPSESGYTLSRALEQKDLIVYLNRSEVLNMFKSSKVLPDNDYFNLVKQSLSVDKDGRTLAGSIIHQLDYSIYGDYQTVWGTDMGFRSNSAYDDFHVNHSSILKQSTNEHIVNTMIEYLYGNPLINRDMFIKTFNFVSDLFVPYANKGVRLSCK